MSENYLKKEFIAFLKKEKVYALFKNELKNNDMFNIINELFEVIEKDSYINLLIINNLNDYGNEKKETYKKIIFWKTVNLKWLLHLLLHDYDVELLNKIIKELNEFQYFAQYVDLNYDERNKMFNSIVAKKTLLIPKEIDLSLIETIIKISYNNRAYRTKKRILKPKKKKNNKKLERHEKVTSYYRPSV